MTLQEQIKEFNSYLGDNESQLDRDYKRLSNKIVLLWGHEEFYSFINKLLINDRDYNRKGFSLEVIQELQELSDIHDRLFPDKRQAVINFWV